jgi:hypothetical protein
MSDYCDFSDELLPGPEPKESHDVCKNLKLSIRQQSRRVVLKLEDPLAMREVEVECEVNESTVLSRTYHIREAIVIGMRRLMFAALEGGLVKISLSGSLGALTTSNKKVPLVKWEPKEEDIFGSLIPPE